MFLVRKPKRQDTSTHFKLFPNYNSKNDKRTSTFVFIAVCRTTLAAFLIFNINFNKM